MIPGVTPPAHSFVRDFAPAPAETFRVDHHYLVCVSRGVLRLESGGTSWTLPPARAAIITAGHPVEIAIPQAVVSSSALFSPDFVAAPPAPLAVFDLTPLARALISECGRWGPDSTWSDHAASMFRALAACCWELATRPSPARMPVGRSPEVRRALALTEATIADAPTIEAVAHDVGLASRSLARRFEDELGMTWRAALRRARLLRSIELLAGDESRSIAAIAMDVGYSSLSAFNAAFRDLVGQTPSDYRATFRPF
jgi:AraC-like DNA-binding protein